MNLLILCPHFAPDLAPTGEVMSAIAAGLVDRGHRLHLVTALPWYEHHRVEPEWEGRWVRHDDHPWGRVTRVHPFPTDKRNIPARAAAFAGFTALSELVALASRARPDAVLAMSPPLTLGAAGWSAAKRFGVPFVFNIQDVFPDVAVELGAIVNPRVIATASALERLTYQGADAVTVLSDDLRDNVVAKLAGRRRGDASKVRVIPNFVDTERIRPGPAENSYRREYGLEAKTVVMYAGNVGLSQSLDMVIDAAAGFADDPDVVFVINGGGSGRPELERRAAGMANVRFVDMQPRERLPEVLAAADIHLVPLKAGLARSSVPSKTYSILAAGRPVVASVDRGTEVARTVTAAGAGIAVAPDEAEPFAKAVRQLVHDPARRAEMGQAGRAFVERWLSPAAVAASYESLFVELIEARHAAPRSRWPAPRPGKGVGPDGRVTLAPGGRSRTPRESR
ncbi:MAG TPA: glycosyltransferase family 4 protein [Acidimicrobiales bacterium]|jgi:colanic acid biosynthesis glycosyl transferase WcaI|nr:glycosyltransferase family 4 protein [Acidimicrobiales bacterium]